MAHVQLTTDDSGNAITLLVDGVDMTSMVMCSGFSISMKEGRPMMVSLRLVPGALDVDLPECVVAAVRRSEEIDISQPGDLEPHTITGQETL